MRTRSRNPFTTVTTSGLLLPVDLLTRVVEGDPDLPGLSPKDYHLRSGERLNEAASRAWNECLACWKSFRKKLKALPASDAGTTLTRDEWLLPLFQELGYGRLQAKKAIEIEGKEYPISHGWENHVPIHLLSAKLPLDRRTPGAAGAATRAPYSLLQEQLNRSTQHRWGFVSNGLKLFLLRDNAALARAANVEFDLEAMMDGEVYSDFMLLFLLCHQSRVEILGSGGSDDEDQRANPEDCWLEKWANQADQQGTRARERLRDGVEAAIKALGAGFLTTKGNNQLRNRLRTGDLSTQDFYRELLRVVYRLLMLLVAEEKRSENGQNLFHPPDTPPEVRERYARFYSVGRIRSLAYERRGTAHTDLYESLKVLFLKLREGYAPLGIPGMGSFLFSDDSTPDLDRALLANQDLLDAFRQLCYTEDTSGRGGGVRRPVDFGNLGSEELGSVYESLLELHPKIGADDTFILDTAAGHERKTTGSYYTPRSLINCVLESSLDPVINQAIDVSDQVEAEQKLLDLKVCDPACGSGHFLIAAAERMATHLARLRTGDDQPNTLDVQHAKRDIIGRCIYGVDVNPMAVELCKVSLWMEALEPGKPLSFLDHHIQCGNSLIGATPAQLADGIPDDAFSPNDNDDKDACKDLKKSNKKERQDFKSGQGYLFEPLFKLGNAAAEFARLTASADDSLDSVALKRQRYSDLVRESSYRNAQFWADTWYAAFVWKKDDTEIGRLCPTERKFRDIERNPHNVLPHVREEIESLSAEYRFFHWHLAFPDVFTLKDGDLESDAGTVAHWDGGFDVVVGNPPWELVAADQGQMADETFGRLQYLFRVNSYSVLSGRRDLYKLFLVQGRSLISRSGILSFLTPFGFYVENESADFRRSLFDAGSVLELRHFQNHGKVFFENVHASYRFCQITFTREIRDTHRFTCTATGPHQISSVPTFSISRREFDSQLGKMRAAVVFPNESYGRVHQQVSKTLSNLVRDDFNVVAEFHSSTDKKLISPDRRNSNDWVVLKNRNIHQFDHLFAEPEAWVTVKNVESRIARKKVDQKWFDVFPRLVFRDIARNDDERTLIACLAPVGFLSSYDTPMVVPETKVDAAQYLIFYAAAFNAFVSDFVIRPFVDKHIKGYILNRVPWPDLESLSSRWCFRDLVLSSTLELIGTNTSFRSFLFHCGYNGPPFRWDEERRFQIRCELDAAYFHLYLGSDEEWGADNPTLREMFPTPRDAVDYIMDTFPIVRRKDEAKYDGDYRTKRTILEIYDAMAQAIRTGQPYQTRLAPPPGPPTDGEGNFIPFDQWTADLNTSHIHPPRVDRQRVEQGRLVLDLLLLLEAWKQPVSITALEPALLLMRNDAARKALQVRDLTAVDQAELQSPPQFIVGIDRLYAAIEANGAIRQVGEHGYELAKPELLNEVSQSDRDRANEIVQAVAQLNDLRSLPELVAELTDARYEVTV